MCGRGKQGRGKTWSVPNGFDFPDKVGGEAEDRRAVKVRKGLWEAGGDELSWAAVSSPTAEANCIVGSTK